MTTKQKGPLITIKIDHDAHNILSSWREDLKQRGIQAASFSEVIREINKRRGV